MPRFAVLAVGLALAPSAVAANIATPRMVEVASWAAGKPVSVWCENDEAEWGRMTGVVGHSAETQGYAHVGGSKVWLSPTACMRLAGPVQPSLALGLHVLLHESWHAKGHHDEAFAECAARVLIYSALNRFYGVPWGPRMRAYTDIALWYSLRQPAAYQGGCERL